MPTIKAENYPYVTIGLCIKNEERTIAECLQSILNLDYPGDKLELIIVDNMSTDNTLEICKNLLTEANINCKLLNNKEKGLGYSRQLVVENAMGKYIVWMDGDSVATSNLVKAQIEFMEKERSLGVGIATILPPKGASAMERLDAYQFLIPMLNAIKKDKTPPLPSLGSVTRSRVIREVGGFNSRLYDLEDTDLFSKILSKGYKIRGNARAIIYHYMSYYSFTRLFKRGYRNGHASRQIFSLGRMLQNLVMGSLLRIKSFYHIVRDYRDSISCLLPFFVVVYEAGILLGYLSAPTTESRK